MRGCILSAVVLTLLIGVAGHTGARAEDKPPGVVKIPEKVKKDFGERTIDILSGATKVEVFRLGDRVGKKEVAKALEGWTVTETGKEKGKAFAAKMRGFLFDEATRIPSGAGGFSADVAFRLWKEKESVTVVVDLRGHSFRVRAYDADGKQIAIAGGGFLFNAKREFDSGELFARIHGLAVEAFPGDEKLKGLKKPEIISPDD
jgi:hypothetical protein